MNKNMETYLKNVEFSDVKIRVKNNEEFPAHKVFLASSSSVFKKMLTTDMKESRDKCINLPELDSDTVTELLHFLYYGKLDKASDKSAILLELVKAADMYLISDLKRVCDVLLSRLLTSENVLSLLEISRTYKLPIVRQQSLIFIANHVNVLLEEEM
ncbi:ARM REPEAT PROTEIN INTERACTING WITH ABF2-like [Cotesia glomerata]|uniref:ARM REPEAT PROTEIN INTERACTING WITH ABF2-like n=1 Tax=Cotesia glomerata TaxID=32391 RepID=UPI001D017368|nr:ARM REPEAT PROTEIN INTERACTING WITH ABF2-like [Cotesia glomerata]